jgi:hypothetical protein
MSKNVEIRDNTVAEGTVTKAPVTIDKSCLQGTITARNNTLT